MICGGIADVGESSVMTNYSTRSIDMIQLGTFDSSCCSVVDFLPTMKAILKRICPFSNIVRQTHKTPMVFSRE